MFPEEAQPYEWPSKFRGYETGPNCGNGRLPPGWRLRTANDRLPAGRKLARFERGDIAHFREECPVVIASQRNFKGDPQGSKKGGKGNPKGKRCNQWGKGQGKGRKSGPNAQFAEVENGAPRNAALATEQTESFTEENDVNFADREVLISRTVLWKADWGLKHWGGNSNNGDCPCIIDTGFNGGAFCIFNCVRRYKAYFRSIYPYMPKLGGNFRKANEICFSVIMAGWLASFCSFTYLSRASIFTGYVTSYHRRR